MIGRKFFRQAIDSIGCGHPWISRGTPEKMLLSLLYILSSLAILFCASAGVKDTTFYDLLGVNPQASLETLRDKFVYHSDQFNLHVFSNHAEEAKRLREIVRKVYFTLRDPHSRKDYDENGPPFHVDLKEFSLFFLDFMMIGTLQTSPNGFYIVNWDRYFENVGFKTQVAPLTQEEITFLDFLDIIKGVHVRRDVEWFIEALLYLMRHPISSLIHPPARSDSPSLKKIYYLQDFDEFPSSEPAIVNLETFKSFLGSLIRRYARFIPQIEGQYTIYDRIVNLEKYLGKSSFMLLLAKRLPKSTLCMLSVNNPFELFRAFCNFINPDLAVLNISTNVPSITPTSTEPSLASGDLENARDNGSTTHDEMDESSDSKKRRASPIVEEVEKKQRKH